MKFRKKPVVIEAEQYMKWGTFARGMCDSMWCPKHGNDIRDTPHVHTIHNNQAVPLEVGDWIIPEPDGIHFYPCKPDIFEATYEPVEDAQTPSDRLEHWDENCTCWSRPKEGEGA